jgi:hypothetical protein
MGVLTGLRSAGGEGLTGAGFATCCGGFGGSTGLTIGSGLITAGGAGGAGGGGGGAGGFTSAT